MKVIKLVVTSVLLIGLRSLVLGQGIEIKGIVSDNASAPLPYASVIVKDDSTQAFRGTISDLTGNFSLSLSDIYYNDTIRFSSVGFRKLLVPVRALLTGRKEKIILSESDTILDTVIFQDLKPKELIIKCIKEVPHNYLNVSFSNEGFYWKSVKEDSVFKSHEEALVSLHESHSEKGSRRDFLYDSIASLGVPLKNYIVLDSVENLFYFDFIRSGSGIINLSTIDEWKFEYLNINSKEFRNATVVQAKRGDGLVRFNIYINTNDYSFERIEFQYRWNQDFHDLNKSLLYNVDKVEGVVQYEKTNRKYSVKYLFIETEYSAYKKYTFKKQFSRITSFEFTLLSSLEMKYNTKFKNNDRNFSFKPVIVNTNAYCKATSSLGRKIDLCK